MTITIFFSIWVLGPILQLENVDVLGKGQGRPCYIPHRKINKIILKLLYFTLSFINVCYVKKWILDLS